MAELHECAMHTVTTKPWPIERAIDEYARAGFGGVSIWRDAMAGRDPAAIRRRLHAAGLAGVSLVRGGFFAHADPAARAAALEDNRRCIAEAHELELPLIVLVCGAEPTVSLPDNRRMITDALATLAPEARAAGIRLGIEPLHPMYADTRSAVNTLAQAHRIAEAANRRAGTGGAAAGGGGTAAAPDGSTSASPPAASSPAAPPFPAAPARATVCGVVDVYHLWWDERLDEDIAAAGAAGLLAAFHVCDWRVPTEHFLLDRGLMGEGCIDVPSIRRRVTEAGFTGLTEVEIFSERFWAMDQNEWLDQVVRSCRAGGVMRPRRHPPAPLTAGSGRTVSKETRGATLGSTLPTTTTDGRSEG